MTIRIVTIVGARPQFIKASAVSHAIARRSDVEEILVHTGQHYDENMSDVFFDELAIPKPSYHLGVGSAPHGAQTGRMLEAIERVLLELRPNWLLVYGDTNSTLAGAIAASKLHVPIAHVEAGLRSFNRRMPEEINRVLTDHTADLLFAPTEVAMKHLLAEGIPATRIRQVGDVMYDVALWQAERAKEQSRVLETHNLIEQGYVLATIHRAENTDSPERLTAIIKGLAEAADELPIVLPLHPRTRQVLAHSADLQDAANRLRLIEPVGYLDMVRLEQAARLIATDSGGVQKEAFFHGTPCVTLRDETEWVELIELGWNRLVSPSNSDVVTKVLQNALAGGAGRPGRPYGDGHAADYIVEALVAPQQN